MRFRNRLLSAPRDWSLRLGAAAAIMVAALALALLPIVAAAHADLFQSSPTPNQVVDSAPAELKLWFTETADVSFTQVKIINQQGQIQNVVGTLRGDQTNSRVVIAPLQKLPHGIYTVLWHAISLTDGHATTGSFAFAIGQEYAQAVAGMPTARGESPSNIFENVTVTAVSLRWSGYVAQALLFGGFAFFPLAFAPAIKRASRKWNEAQREGPAWGSGVLTAPQPASPYGFALAVLAISCVVSIVVTILSAAATAGAGTQTSGLEAFGAPLWRLLTGSSGLYVWARLGLLIAIGIVIALGVWRVRARGHLAVGWWVAGIVLSSLLLLTTSLHSHAAADLVSLPSTIGDWMHLLTSAVWLGGLVMLLFSLPLLYRLGSGMRAFAGSSIIGRFSLIATFCVAIMPLTGFFRALDEIVDPRDLGTTSYGVALLYKVGLVLGLIGLAGINPFIIKGPLDGSVNADDPDQEAGQWYKMLRYTVIGEAITLSLVLLMASVLTGISPARQSAGHGTWIYLQDRNIQSEVIIYPGRPGFNTIDIYLWDGGRNRIVDFEKVALIFTLNGPDGPVQTEAVAKVVSGNYFTVEGDYISLPQTYQVVLLVRRPGMYDDRLPMVFQPGGLANEGSGVQQPPLPFWTLAVQWVSSIHE